MHFAIDADIFMQVVSPALEDSDLAKLGRLVRCRWRPRQLAHLVRHDDVHIRRTAALTLGIVGDSTVIGCLARALVDSDDQVHRVAEQGMWSIWFRGGDPEASRPFHEGMELLGQQTYARAAEQFETAVRIDPEFAEAHNQCAIAYYLHSQWRESLRCSGNAVRLMPTHFGALSGMGHCLMELGEPARALRCYHGALQINPRMDAIASTARRLESALELLAGSSDDKI